MVIVNDSDVRERRTEHVASRRRHHPGHLLDGAHRAQFLRELSEQRRPAHQHLPPFHLRTELASCLLRQFKCGAQLQMARRCGGQRVEQGDVLGRPLAGNPVDCAERPDDVAVGRTQREPCPRNDPH